MAVAGYDVKNAYGKCADWKRFFLVATHAQPETPGLTDMTGWKLTMLQFSGDTFTSSNAKVFRAITHRQIHT